MKKKLLSIIPHASTGGLPQVLVKKVELIKEDLDVYVVEYNNYSNDFVIQKNRLRNLLQPDHFFTLGDRKEEILEIIENIKNLDYIHFEEIPELFNISFDIAKEIYREDRKYKIFETTHSSDFNVDDKIFFPDKFLFVSQYNCFKFNKFGIPTEVIEYPVEKNSCSLERKLELQKKFGLDPKYKHIVNVGLFTPRKNQAYAFEIARKLLNEKIQFHFIGNQADNFQSYWRPLMKIKPKNCKIWGERDDIDDFLDASDLFLFTSMGFRWNKELNPLVIKEALEHEIPQFLFPLDVYNRKYDNEETIQYLNGDVDIDASYIKNSLFPRTFNFSTNKPKIRAVHLLLEEDNRKSESIKELEKLKDFGIDYVQHVNKRFTDRPPKEFCARPNDVGRIGAYSLRGPHYGNYQSFRKAILTEFTNEIDFLMIFESDCKLLVPIEEFVEKVFASCDPITQRGIYYMSFGDNRNLRTSEIVSDNHGQINDWMYQTNKIIGIQSIMFPKFAFPFIKRAYDTTLWDVSDLMFNDMFKNKGKAIAPRLTTQIEGVSTIQGEAIEHFLLKDQKNLKDKKPEDVIVEYNSDDQKFYLCLSDFYQRDIANFSIVVNVDKTNSIYRTDNITLSPYTPIWIQIFGQNKYNEFMFDIYNNNEFLFTKKIILNSPKGLENPINHIREEDKIQENKKSELIEIRPDDFNLDYHSDDNKVYLPYIGNLKDLKLGVVLKEITTGNIVFKADELVFNNSEYCNWICPSKNLYRTDPDFKGYSADYMQNDLLLFTREIILKSPNKKIIDIQVQELNKDKTFRKDEKIAFMVTTYPDTKIKEEITEKCVNAIKNAGNDIILVSHFPVSESLQEKVDYYIYDSYNPLIKHSLYNFYWSEIDKGKVEIKLDKLKNTSNLNQSLTVLNNVENAVKFAKYAGYDKIVAVSYDFIFNKINIDKIQSMCKRMDIENKKGFFMSYYEGDMKLYKTVFFIINPDFYSNVFNTIIRTPEAYNKECQDLGCHNFLESLFYNKLSKHEDQLIIENITEEKLFEGAEINIFSGVEYLAILPVKDQSYSFIIWFNSSNTKDDRRIEFMIENKGIVERTTHFIKEKSYYLKKITLSERDDYNITAHFIDSNSNVIIEKYNYNLNINNYNDILENGLFNERTFK